MTVPPTVLKGQEWIMPVWLSDALSYWKYMVVFDESENNKRFQGLAL